jgi:signal transduction histidine kinase
MHRSQRLAALGEMAAGVAHEIRNPLGGIELYAGLLARELAGNDKEKPLADKILSGARHLDGIVEGMLAFTREMAPERQRVDLVRVARRAVEQASGEIESSGVAVVFEGDVSVGAVGDEELMTRVLVNIVRNACQAMPSGGKLTVECRREDTAAGPRALCRVSDTGEGIPTGALDRIFNPFFTARDGGTGLGLAISHRIIEAHGGEIAAENDPRGGAVFTVRIEGGAE